MLYFFYWIETIGCYGLQKKSLNRLNQKESYEEIDTRLASGWYVDAVDSNKNDSIKKKKYKTEKVSFKISKKI